MGSVDTFECAHTEGTVDTVGHEAPTGAAKKKQRRRTIKERRYREGQLGITIATPLLPVKVKTERLTKTLPENGAMLSPGTMEVKLSRGTLRIAGSVDVLALRAVLQCLAG